MTLFRTIADRLRSARTDRPVVVKALSFALVGIVNAGVDYTVFFLARAAFASSPRVNAAADAVVAACNCLDAATWILIPANLTAWIVAVSGSYVMNSLTTFSRESGGRLSGRAYVKFVGSGVAGVTASTATVIAAVLVLPIWAAKLLAILVGFVVNFTLSNFVVFRTRPENGA